MERVIYVQLLDEGTIVYRPVLSLELSPTIYKLGGTLIYNSRNEKWEFLPGETVQVEEKYLEGNKVLVAVRRVDAA